MHTACNLQTDEHFGAAGSGGSQRSMARATRQCRPCRFAHARNAELRAHNRPQRLGDPIQAMDYKLGAAAQRRTVVDADERAMTDLDVEKIVRGGVGIASRRCTPSIRLGLGSNADIFVRMRGFLSIKRRRRHYQTSEPTWSAASVRRISTAYAQRDEGKISEEELRPHPKTMPSVMRCDSKKTWGSI